MQKKIIINWAVELKSADKIPEISLNPPERKKIWNFVTMKAQIFGFVGLILVLTNQIEAARWTTQSYSKFAQKYESTSAQCKAESAFPFFTRSSSKFYNGFKAECQWSIWTEWSYKQGSVGRPKIARPRPKIWGPLVPLSFQNFKCILGPDSAGWFLALKFLIFKMHFQGRNQPKSDFWF